MVDFPLQSTLPSSFLSRFTSVSVFMYARFPLITSLPLSLSLSLSPSLLCVSMVSWSISTQKKRRDEGGVKETVTSSSVRAAVLTAGAAWKVKSKRASVCVCVCVFVCAHRSCGCAFIAQWSGHMMVDTLVPHITCEVHTLEFQYILYIDRVNSVLGKCI